MNGLFDWAGRSGVSLCVPDRRGHREMPIEAQFTGRVVQTSKTEIIEVRLREKTAKNACACGPRG